MTRIKIRFLSVSSVALDGRGDRVIEDLERDVDVFFGQYQRRRPATRPRPRPENDQATLETRHLNSIAQLRRLKLDTEHHSHAAHVDDAVVLLLQLPEPRFQISTDFSRILDQTA